jgi:hypothetical protein
MFKITSFRPWLVTLRNINKTLTEKISESNMLQIAKCKDLFDFGSSIFDFMIGKKSEY